MADGQLTHIATFLPVRRWRDVPPFIMLSLRVSRQAKKSAGYIAHALKADLPKRQFWTLSVWENRQAASHFVKSEPHSTAVKKFKAWADDSAAFVEWSKEGESIDWREAMERLKTPMFYFKK
jgi:Domain of unknown function (DUF3291)